MTVRSSLSDDVHTRMLAAEAEVEQLRQALLVARERERLLSHELQHRVRNMLAVIRTICRRTMESGASHDEFAQHFQGRLDSLARYHAEMADPGSTGIELEDVVRDELLRVQVLDGDDLTIDGPPIRLGGKSLELMSLAIHELTTNAVKFGALYRGGKLHISWSVERADGHVLTFRWTETAVSPVAVAPRPHGFGRQLLEEALPYQLGATTSFDLRPGGLACVVTIPRLGTIPDSSAPIRQFTTPETGERP